MDPTILSSRRRRFFKIVVFAIEACHCGSIQNETVFAFPEEMLWHRVTDSSMLSTPELIRHCKISSFKGHLGEQIESLGHNSH